MYYVYFMTLYLRVYFIDPRTLDERGHGTLKTASASASLVSDSSLQNTQSSCVVAEFALSVSYSL